MKHVFLLCIFAFFMLSCGEESKPTPEKKTIQPAKTNGNLLIPVSANNEWTYERTEYPIYGKGEIVKTTAKCYLQKTHDYYFDDKRQKSFARYKLFSDNEMATPLFLSLREFFINQDTLILQGFLRKEELLYIYDKNNLPQLDYEFGIEYNYKVDDLQFDTVYTVKNYSHDKSFKYFAKGVGLIHEEYYWNVDGIYKLQDEYKIKSAVLK
ncbi:MAG: hypothetical protein IAE98_06030 [Candidatus Kapabacteria bacterium]|nr:hypothetical protein [Candidatus Kapabacteria bacterium]